MAQSPEDRDAASYVRTNAVSSVEETATAIMSLFLSGASTF